MILQERPFRSKLAGSAKGAVCAGILTTALVAAIAPIFAQGSPVPGSSGGGNADGYGNGYNQGRSPGSSNAYGGYGSAEGPADGGSASASLSAPVPGAGRAATEANIAPAKTGKSKYRDLPLTVDSAKYRLAELRAMLAVSRPQDMQDSVQELCEWLNDSADAHYRMYLAFAKSDLTKPQANSEKQLNQHFSQLKREAQLLRADLLIKGLRAPEALAPLVDIVVADPRSGTGKEAYKRLVDLGFSQALPSAVAPTGEVCAAVTAPAMAPVTAPAVAPKDIKTQANSQTLKPLH